MWRLTAIAWSSVACAAQVTHFPTHSLQVTASTAGWSALTEPGWFRVELPGAISEGTAPVATSRGILTFKVVRGLSATHFTMVEYAEVPDGVGGGSVAQLASEMQHAVTRPGYVSHDPQSQEQHGVVRFEVTVDVPPHAGDNTTELPLRFFVRGVVSQHRAMLLVDGRAPDDQDARAISSFTPMI
jgi:hypothetical protein